MRIILYRNWGGFHLSDEVVDIYKEKTGIALDKWGVDEYATYRTDPILMQIIKENDPEDDYKIFNLPKGTEYIVENYDGNEYLTIKDEVKWRVAT